MKKTSACPSFTPAWLPLRHGLPLSPYTTRGALSLSFKAPGKEAQAAQRCAASPSAEAPGVVSGRHLKACAFCWAETGKMALLSWHGVCVQWEWASWPGLQCQDPTLVSGPLFPQTPVCSDSRPSPRSPNECEIEMLWGETPNACLLPQPLQLRFLISAPDKRVGTADAIPDLANYKNKCQAIMGIGCTVKRGDPWSPHCSLLER